MRESSRCAPCAGLVFRSKRAAPLVHNQPQAVIAVTARFAAVSVNRRHRHVERLSSRREVDPELPGLLPKLNNILQEVAHRLADHLPLIRRREAVAGQLDENPLRSSAYADASTAPATKSFKIQGVVFPQTAVLDAQHRQATTAALPVGNKRAAEQDREGT